MGSHVDPPPSRELLAILQSIRGLVRDLRLTANESERQVGISSAQLYVLKTLAASERALSVNDLAEATLTHQSSVSVVVRKLVEQGLVQRRRAPDDARRWELLPTAAGRRLLADAPAMAQEQLIVAARRLPAQTRGELARGLSALREAMATGGGEAPMFFEEEGGRGARRKE